MSINLLICCGQPVDHSGVKIRKAFSSAFDIVTEPKERWILREDITKCSNVVHNKFTNIRQHNKYLLEHISYMFRPVSR